MTRISIGQPLPSTVPAVPGMTYLCSTSGQQLIIGISNPTYKEARGLRGGPFEMRVLGNELCLFILVRFGREGEGMPWGDARFEWWRVDPAYRQMPSVGDPIVVILVDSDNQIVRGIRIVYPDDDFMRALIKGMKLQESLSGAPSKERVDQYIHEMESLRPRELADIAGGRRSLNPAFGDLQYIAQMTSLKSRYPKGGGPTR